SDVAAAVERALEPRRSFDIYNVGSGRGTSTQEVLDLIERTVGRRMLQQRVSGIDHADRLVPWVGLDIGKAERELAWRPVVALEAGIERLYREYRNGAEGADATVRAPAAR